MKVSYKPCVHRHRQRKDKTFSVIIRIGYKSKYSFIETGFLVAKNDLSKKFEIKNQEILNKCNAIITDYTNIVKNLKEELVSDVQDIVTFINKGIDTEKEIDFLVFFKNILEKLLKEKSSSIQIYSATYNHLVSFIGQETYSIKRVTSKFLTDFENHLSKQNIGSRGQNLYLGTVRTVYNLCMDEYEEYGYTFNYPFRKYKLPKVKSAETIALTKEQLLAIINIDLKDNLRANRARNAFVISLFTLGTNASDLYDLQTITTDRIEYKRNKTKSRRNDEAFISIKVESELIPYIEECKGTPPFTFIFREWYSTKPYFNKAITTGLKQIAKMLNEQHKQFVMEMLAKLGKEKEEIDKVIEKDFIHPFDFYDARRTMASVMRNKLGISKDDVAMCLNHVDISHKTTDYYIETDFSILDKCNRMFIDWLFAKDDKLK